MTEYHAIFVFLMPLLYINMPYLSIYTKVEDKEKIEKRRISDENGRYCRSKSKWFRRGKRKT